jgi:hypothetical protein
MLTWLNLHSAEVGFTQARLTELRVREGVKIVGEAAH